MFTLLLGVAGVGGGACWFCKLFSGKDVARDASGVIHDEHNPATGEVLPAASRGARLIEFSEKIFNPLCAPINKLLGRK